MSPVHLSSAIKAVLSLNKFEIEAENVQNKEGFVHVCRTFFYGPPTIPQVSQCLCNLLSIAAPGNEELDSIA